MCEKMSRSEAGKLGGLASKESIAKRHSLFVEKYEACPKLCKYCNKAILYEKRRNDFCSSSCAASHSNRQRFTPKRDLRLKSCVICNTITKNEKCCSRKCAGKWQKQKTYEKIRSGKYTYSWSGGNNAAKSFVIEERGEACEECKRKTWRGEKLPLGLHHIDGDATNNLPSNLQLLCGNCHSITKNFGRKNKKSTRIYRYRGQSGEALAW